MMDKKLYKSQTNKVFAGVCGGISEVYGVNVKLVRWIWAIVSLIWPPIGIVVYVILVFSLPEGKINVSSQNMGQDELQNKKINNRMNMAKLKNIKSVRKNEDVDKDSDAEKDSNNTNVLYKEIKNINDIE